MPRSEFFRRRPHSRAMELRAYGKIPVYAIPDLPIDLKKQLEDLRMERQCGDYEELIRLKQQENRLASILRLILARLAPRRAESFAVQSAMFAFFRRVDNGAPTLLAYRSVRHALSKTLGWKPSERTVRRIILRVDSFGGPELAPLDAYSDVLMSISHRRTCTRSRQ